jgi:hypothetical protein
MDDDCFPQQHQVTGDCNAEGTCVGATGTDICVLVKARRQ